MSTDKDRADLINQEEPKRLDCVSVVATKQVVNGRVDVTIGVSESITKAVVDLV